MPEDSAPESGFRSIGEIARNMLAGMQKCCSPATGYGKEIDGRRGVTSTRDGLTATLSQEDKRMTALAEYKPIRLGTIGEHSENFPASDAAPEGQEGGE